MADDGMTPEQMRNWEARHESGAFRDYVVDTLARIDERTHATDVRMTDHLKYFEMLQLDGRLATLEERTPSPAKTATFSGTIGGVFGALLAVAVAVFRTHTG